MLISTILFSIVIVKIWRWSPFLAVPLVGLFLMVDLAFFAATITKVAHGGWFPLVAGISIFVLLMTWKRGRDLLFTRLKEEAIPTTTFLNSLSSDVVRVRGTAVFLTATADGVPHALLHNMKHNQVVHERVVFLTVVTEDIAHVADDARISIQHLGRRFYRVILRYGYNDATDIPAAFKLGKDHGLEIDNMTTSYFLGRETLIPSAHPGMALWREGVFAWMSRMSTSAMDFFMLPPNRVVELGTQIEF